MKESFKQKMQENKPPLTFKNTKKNICLEKNGIFFLTLTPTTQSGDSVRLSFAISCMLQSQEGAKYHSSPDTKSFDHSL